MEATRRRTAPKWHLDLVRIRRDRPDMTHEEVASTLGRTLAAVRHALKKPEIREMILYKHDTLELEKKAHALNDQVQTNLEMTENLLGKLKEMSSIAAEQLEGVANGVITEYLQDKSVDPDKRVAVALKVRDQTAQIRESFNLPAPKPGTYGGSAPLVVNLLNSEAMQEVTATVRKLAGGARRSDALEST